MVVIEANDLRFSYGKNIILDGINFSIEKGKLVSIIGPNGSGKTTLLRNMSGALKPSAGSIKLWDKDITCYKKKELAKHIAYVPQSTMVDFGFTVMDIVLMGRSPYIGRFGSETHGDMEVAKDAMEMLGVLKLKDKKITQISGGERQRAAIACALAQTPEVIMLDEPVSNLDIQYQVQVLNLLKNLCLEKGMTALLVLHDLNLASEYSDMVILLNCGRIEHMGSPYDVMTVPVIEKAYNTKIYMMTNPISGKPYLMPIRI
jgi:iron complex transport system ATP-binding protein